MPTREMAWPEGTPCWVDTQLDDPIKGSEFYAAVFGWEIQDSGPESGGYLIATKRGKKAAGIGPKPPGMSMPSAWTTYFAADDADAVQTRIAAAGGTVVVPAMDVLDVGRMLIAADPTGAAFACWQAGSNKGAEIYNEAGAFVWNDLHTKDYAAAQSFYRSVFGWDFIEVGDGSAMVYSVFVPSGGSQDDCLGGFGLDTTSPEGTPAYWLSWFQSDDVDESMDTVANLGGSVLMPAADSPFGHMGVVTGAQGEAFGLINPNRRVGEPPEGR